jgi:Family of unknown function (DUF6580)
MEQRKQSPVAAIITGLAGVLTIVCRLAPHPANFSPVGAMGLFGGGKLRSWLAFAMPLVVMFVSDFGLWLFTGFDANYSPLHISRAYVYASLLIYVAIGMWLLRDRATLGRLLGASCLGSVQFFLVTNFCEWLFQPMQSVELLPVAFRYSRDFSGLLACYAAALPFFQADFPWSLHAFAILGDPRYGALGTLLGDLVFTGALFGLHGLVTQPASAAQPAMEPSHA